MIVMEGLLAVLVLFAGYLFFVDGREDLQLKSYRFAAFKFGVAAICLLFSGIYFASVFSSFGM